MAESTCMKELYETLKLHEQNFLNTGERLSQIEAGLNDLRHTLTTVNQSMEYLLKKANDIGSNGGSADTAEGSGNARARPEVYTPPHVRNQLNQQNFTSATYKLEFPEFNGENPQGWIREANRFFQLNANENTKKVLHAGYYMVGVADTWYMEYIEGRVGIDWECFCEKLLQHFTNFSEKKDAIKNSIVVSEIGQETYQEVKGFTADSLLNPETFKALQKLSIENERLKKKCLEKCSERKRIEIKQYEVEGRYNLGGGIFRITCPRVELVVQREMSERLNEVSGERSKNQKVLGSEIMGYAQLVIGPAGSGKSTYCSNLHQHGEAVGRSIHIVNLDPAVESLDCPVAIDIRELISLEDVMEELGLGPNGILIYCMENLEENLDDWLTEELDNYMEDLLDPALKGTLNVLNSVAKTPSVKRVVLTSSEAAVAFTGKPRTPEVVVDETWFSDLDFCRENKLWYVLSKSLAESSAWKFAKEKGIDLISINPTLVLGPLLQPTLNTSSAVILDMIKGGETYPNVSVGLVNVKDVANAHILAYETPSASGRYVMVEYSEVVKMLSEMYPTFKLPSKCESEPFTPIYQVSKDRIRSLGIELTPLEVSVKETVEHIHKAFMFFDSNGSSYIEIDELRHAFANVAEATTEEVINAIIQDVDQTRDDDEDDGFDDENGLIRQLQYDHLKELHRAIKKYEKAWVSADPTLISLEKFQQARVFTSNSGECAASLSNYVWDPGGGQSGKSQP